MSRSRLRKTVPSGPPTGSTEAQEGGIPSGGAAKVGLLRTARVLFSIALGISVFLAYSSFSGGSVAGCGAGSDCGSVLSSRWAYWFTLPVSVPAAVFYVLLLAASWSASPGRGCRSQVRAWTVLIAGAFAVLGAALWFVGLQAMIIGQWCPYCLAAHAAGASGALLVLLAAPFVIRGKAGEEPLLFGVGRRAWPAVLGMLSLVPVVVGQFLGTPPGASLATMPSAMAAAPVPAPSTNGTVPGGAGPVAVDTPTVAADSGATPDAPKRSRKFSLHNGRYSFDLYEAPLMGKPEAPHVVVSLFDYTCRHCRLQHGLLKRVQASFGDQLAIVVLPMPLDKACNPLLASTAPDHVNACEYARIGMAVWRTRPEVFAEYEEWFFAPETPRPVPEVLAKAAELTGREDFSAATADPWIDEWLKLGRDVFQTNWDLTGRNFLPMVNIGTVLSSGVIETDDELYGILEKHLGLKRPVDGAPSSPLP